ncbi:Centrosomal protein of 104 kDa [Manis javanica]|nr:Centrosomal protein of 104 kDa [Manis javanica]
MVASFNETMKTQVQIVPYRGNGPALNDALAAWCRSWATRSSTNLGISWFGLVVPAGTPPAIVRQLQDASVKAVRLPEGPKHLKLLGASVTEMDQSRFPAQIASELQRNKALLDKAGVKPE